jgi:replicative DNA helicase
MKLFSNTLEMRALALVCRGGPKSEMFLAQLDIKHFHYPPTKAAFARVLSLLNKKSIIPSFSDIENDPVLDEDFRKILRAFPTKRPKLTKTRIDTCFEHLDSFRKMREVYYAAKKVIDTLNGNTVDIEALIDDVSGRIAVANSVIKHKENLVHTGRGNNSSGIVREVLYGKGDPVIPTGFKTFDERNGGFFTSAVAVLAANSGGGKSIGALQIALNMYYSRKSTCVISLEMDKEQYYARFLSNISGVDATKIFLKRLTDTERNKIKSAYRAFVNFGKENGVRWSILAPEEDLSLSQILMTTKPYKYDVTTIDYISLLKDAASENQVRALGEITRRAKTYSRMTHSLVIMLAQLNEEDKVKYSKAIVENADHLWTWRYGDNEKENQMFTVKVDKGRNQQCVNFDVSADFSTMKMYDNGPVKGFDGDDQSDDSDIVHDSEDMFMEDGT